MTVENKPTFYQEEAMWELLESPEVSRRRAGIEFMRENFTELYSDIVNCLGEYFWARSEFQVNWELEWDLKSRVNSLNFIDYLVIMRTNTGIEFYIPDDKGKNRIFYYVDEINGKECKFPKYRLFTTKVVIRPFELSRYQKPISPNQFLRSFVPTDFRYVKNIRMLMLIINPMNKVYDASYTDFTLTDRNGKFLEELELFYCNIPGCTSLEFLPVKKIRIEQSITSNSVHSFEGISPRTTEVHILSKYIREISKFPSDGVKLTIECEKMPEVWWAGPKRKFETAKSSVYGKMWEYSGDPSL